MRMVVPFFLCQFSEELRINVVKVICKTALQGFKTLEGLNFGDIELRIKKIKNYQSIIKKRLLKKKSIK